MGTNEIAKHLYKKSGLEIEGVKGRLV